jgi:hypothetical protein
MKHNQETSHVQNPAYDSWKNMSKYDINVPQHVQLDWTKKKMPGHMKAPTVDIMYMCISQGGVPPLGRPL